MGNTCCQVKKEDYWIDSRPLPFKTELLLLKLDNIQTLTPAQHSGRSRLEKSSFTVFDAEQISSRNVSLIEISEELNSHLDKETLSSSVSNIIQCQDSSLMHSEDSRYQSDDEEEIPDEDSVVNVPALIRRMH